MLCCAYLCRNRPLLFCTVEPSIGPMIPRDWFKGSFKSLSTMLKNLTIKWAKRIQMTNPSSVSESVRSRKMMNRAPCWRHDTSTYAKSGATNSIESHQSYSCIHEWVFHCRMDWYWMRSLVEKKFFVCYPSEMVPCLIIYFDNV